jgi:hypothetical protein
MAKNSCNFVFDNAGNFPMTDHHLSYPKGCLHRFRRLEDFSKFFKRPPLGFNKEEIDDDDFEHVPEDKEKVISPTNPSEGDFGNESVVEKCNINKELIGQVLVVTQCISCAETKTHVIHSHALSTALISQDLNWVH